MNEIYQSMDEITMACYYLQHTKNHLQMHWGESIVICGLSPPQKIQSHTLLRNGSVHIK